jgi:N6-adenosine-specific RNA methylase IME4
MSIDQIYSLPVGNIAADNCALFLWTTNPLLNDSFKVITAWDFQYKTVAFVWCLVDHSIYQVVIEPIEKHSKKLGSTEI